MFTFYGKVVTCASCNFMVPVICKYTSFVMRVFDIVHDDGLLVTCK